MLSLIMLKDLRRPNDSHMSRTVYSCIAKGMPPMKTRLSFSSPFASMVKVPSGLICMPFSLPWPSTACEKFESPCWFPPLIRLYPVLYTAAAGFPPFSISSFHWSINLFTRMIFILQSPRYYVPSKSRQISASSLFLNSRVTKPNPSYLWTDIRGFFVYFSALTCERIWKK